MEARRKLGELLESVYYRNDEIVIERNSKVMGVLITPAQYQVIQQNRERLGRAAEELREGFKDLSGSEIQRLVDDAVQEVRAGRKRKRSA